MVHKLLVPFSMRFQTRDEFSLTAGLVCVHLKGSLLCLLLAVSVA